MPQPIDYATPEVNRKAAQADAIPLLLGGIQVLLSAACVYFGVLKTSLLRFESLQHWYEWPARIWLCIATLGLVYLLCSVSVVIGAIKAHRGGEFYRRYAFIWFIAVVLTELSLMVLSPWPGERRYRWVLLHNMHGDFVDRHNFLDYPYAFLITNPALLFLAGRWVLRKMDAWF